MFTNLGCLSRENLGKSHEKSAVHAPAQRRREYAHEYAKERYADVQRHLDQKQRQNGNHRSDERHVEVGHHLDETPRPPTRFRDEIFDPSRRARRVESAYRPHELLLTKNISATIRFENLRLKIKQLIESLSKIKA